MRHLRGGKGRAPSLVIARRLAEATSGKWGVIWVRDPESTGRAVVPGVASSPYGTPRNDKVCAS